MHTASCLFGSKSKFQLFVAEKLALLHAQHRTHRREKVLQCLELEVVLSFCLSTDPNNRRHSARFFLLFPSEFGCHRCVSVCVCVLSHHSHSGAQQTSQKIMGRILLMQALPSLLCCLLTLRSRRAFFAGAYIHMPPRIFVFAMLESIFLFPLHVLSIREE